MFAVLHRGAKTVEVATSRVDLNAIATRHATARYLDGPYVDETFVRWLLDPQRRH